MAHGKGFPRTVLRYGGFAALCALSACASSSGHAPRRELASNAAAQARACVRNSLEESSRTVSRERRESLHSLLSFVPQSTEKGALEKLRASEQRVALQRALLESHLEGELLVKQFSEQLEAGKTLEEIDESTPIYSRLQALRILKTSVEEALQEAIDEAAEAELRKDFLRAPDQFSPETWAASWEKTMEREVDATARSLKIPKAVAREALLDIRADVGAMDLSFSPCFPASTRPAPLATETASRAIPPVERRSFIRPKRFVEIFSRELRDMKRSAPAPKSVHYPDVGTPGNITGNTFPQGAWAMTYDDGPGPYTATLLDQLDRRKVKATFFILGDKISSFPHLPGRILDAGHSVNSHSHSHPVIPKLDSAGKRRQIVTAVNELEKLLGSQTKFFRLPYGSGVAVSSVRELIKEAGLIHVFWNVDTLDWQIKTVDGIVKNTLKQIANLGPSRNRGVILFHDVHERTVGSKDVQGRFVPGASLRVIDELSKPEKKVRFVTLPQIVDELNGAIRR